MIKRYEKYNLRKIAQVSEKNIKQHDYDILQIIQAGLPIYVLLLSGNNFLLYSTIGISFKSIPKWKLKSELLTDLLALHKIRRKVDATHT